MISIQKDEKNELVYVYFEESKFSLPSLPIDDFPVMDINELETTIELESFALKKLIDNCKFCMGLDESRQYLNGIFLHLSKILYRLLPLMVIDCQKVHLRKTLLEALMV